MTYYISTYPTRMARRMITRPAANQSTDYALAVNIREEQEAYILSALVPGLKADDLNIQILEDVVTIEGVYAADESEYLLRELPHGEFHRSLRLPVQLDADQAEAKIKDGLLTLRVPKAESARPKTIKVAVK
jgi:HSP20 family protein